MSNGSRNGNGSRWKWMAGILAGVCLTLVGGFGQSVSAKLRTQDVILREHDITLATLKECMVRIEAKLDRILGD